MLMLRRISVAVWLLLVPSLLAAPKVPVKKLAIPQLDGTTWISETFEKRTMLVTFLPNGILRYSYGGTTYENGTWKQTGDTLYWEKNQKYAEFNAKITSEKIEGKCHNVTGLKWETTLVPSEGTQHPQP
ncbi:MAG: hypothetical protein R3B84_15655 [Zavarzinella sp.]